MKLSTICVYFKCLSNKIIKMNGELIYLICYFHFKNIIIIMWRV
jgi:hypothetical protein